jgi:hypothetical protein
MKTPQFRIIPRQRNAEIAGPQVTFGILETRRQKQHAARISPALGEIRVRCCFGFFTPMRLLFRFRKKIGGGATIGEFWITTSWCWSRVSLRHLLLIYCGELSWAATGKFLPQFTF